MHKTLEVLSLRRRSEAGNVEDLQQAVRSVLADAWHSPAVVLCMSQPSNIRTRVGIALDPRMLRHLQAAQVTQLTHELCRWMRGLHIEYTVGYLPYSATLPVTRNEHRLTVEIFRSIP